jgi:hypothetical protein
MIRRVRHEHSDTPEREHTFLAEEVIVPGKMMIPFAMFFSSRMLRSLRRVELRIRTCECHSQCIEDTNFRMVFTPTLFSSEKNTNI